MWTDFRFSFRLKSHHVDEDNSESDDDEFTGKGVVYDSDEEEDGPSDDNLTADKRKVLTFFNEGGDHELTGIQGCNKKKVVDEVEEKEKIANVFLDYPDDHE